MFLDVTEWVADSSFRLYVIPVRYILEITNYRRGKAKPGVKRAIAYEDCGEIQRQIVLDLH